MKQMHTEQFTSLSPSLSTAHVCTVFSCHHDNDPLFSVLNALVPTPCECYTFSDAGIEGIFLRGKSTLLILRRCYSL